MVASSTQRSDTRDALDRGTARTRELTALERASVARVRAADEVLAGEENSEPRLVGAIRAHDECTCCHSVAVGDLLGEFTCRFAPRDTAHAAHTRPAHAERALP